MSSKTVMPPPGRILPDRAQPIPVNEPHVVSGRALTPPFPENTERAMFGMGCFWGAERKFWQTPGVWVTAVGYSAGVTANPSYRDVCSGLTGHSEVVLVVFEPARIRYDELLRIFWENHDPTQGMRQGNDIGTQYRSGIYFFDARQQQQAETSKAQFQLQLTAAGFGNITTEILPAGPFHYAETEHQQYLARHPDGYCGLGGTGVSCPVGIV